MNQTIIAIVTRMEEKLGSLDAKIDAMKEDNANQHIQITRRLDISNGRLAKGEERDDEILDRIEKIEEADKQMAREIEETNIIAISKWLTSNRKFFKVIVGILLTLGAIFSVVHFFIEDIFHITE